MKRPRKIDREPGRDGAGFPSFLPLCPKIRRMNMLEAIAMSGAMALLFSYVFEKRNEALHYKIFSALFAIVTLLWAGRIVYLICT